MFRVQQRQWQRQHSSRRQQQQQQQQQQASKQQPVRNYLCRRHGSKRPQSKGASSETSSL